MRIVVAPDKFKGSLSAADVASSIARGIRSTCPAADVLEVPIADGGEGTIDAAVAAGYERVEVAASGPTGAPIQAAFALRGGSAVIEMAAASGLGLLPGRALAPLTATSFGTGQVIRAALDHRCTEIVLGVGGSASTDGGAGLLVALGARLSGPGSTDLASGGGALVDLARVDLSGLDRRLRDIRVVLATDVDNPLLGPSGAAAVFAPQKGATPADVALLELGLRRWADACRIALGDGAPSYGDEPGAGAAGGVGFAALAVLHAARRRGVDVVLELVDFANKINGADLVITGEGSLDAQTLQGKAPSGVAVAAGLAGVPVVAVAGRTELTAETLTAAGFAATYTLAEIEPDVRRCLLDACALLERIGARIGVDVQA